MTRDAREPLAHSERRSSREAASAASLYLDAGADCCLEQPFELRCSPRFHTSVTCLYALVASDCRFAVELFATRELADIALAEVLNDEPEFASLLRIARIALEMPELPVSN